MLIAQRFDPRSGVLSSEPLSIADSVSYTLKDGFAAFATSRNGSVAFRTRTTQKWRMAWFDRAGRSIENLKTLGALEEPSDVAIDPEGRRVLFDRTQPKNRAHNLWILDIERSVETRVTSDPTDERVGRWLPDGKSIVYTAEGGGMVQLRRRDLTTGRVEVLLPYGEDEQAGEVAPGGTQLTYLTLTDQGNAEPRFVSLSGDHKTSALSNATTFDEAGGFSPDGRAICFAWGDPGREKLYVASSASPGERIQISSGGSIHGFALWSRDSSEIFYLSPSGQMMSVPIRTKPSVSAGKPSVLFTTKKDAAWDTFDVSPDGKRFLAVFPEGAAEEPPLDVVLNWQAEAATQRSPAR
jgi:Tol biopolymer transport system component